MLPALAVSTPPAPVIPRSCSSCRHGIPPILAALLTAIEARDPETAGHSRRVTRLALKVADVLDLDVQAQHRLRIAAELHDIGKIGVDDAILRKTGLLTDAERVAMQQHAAIGARIVGAVFPEIEADILFHHEWMNGRGYFGLIGAVIPLASRIIAVCDSWDAMTSDRVYRRGMRTTEAWAVMVLDEGNQWDAELVQALLEVV